jgi:hypothetical protein
MNCLLAEHEAKYVLRNIGPREVGGRDVGSYHFHVDIEDKNDALLYPIRIDVEGECLFLPDSRVFII